MASSFVLQRVRIFDGQQVIPAHSLVVKDGIISALGEDLPHPPGSQVLDGSGMTLLPGLIDAHTHVWNAAVLRQALLFGVTTELDMFMSVKTMQQLKRRLAGQYGSPLADLRSAGSLATAPGGHGTEYRIRVPSLHSATEAEGFVADRHKEGSDYLKIVYDDGRAIGRTQPTISKDTMIALIQAAHRRGMLALVHTISFQEAREAIEAGADGLAHLFADTRPDSAFGQWVAAHHAFVIPTLTVLENTCGLPGGQLLTDDDRLAPYLSSSVVGTLRWRFSPAHTYPHDFAVALDATAQLKAAGVPILAGTDAPNPGTAHGASLHRELALLVEAGLTPLEALASATSVTASLFGLKDRGRIAPGLRADLLLVRGDPTRTIEATRDIVQVWKQGVPVNRENDRARLEKQRQKMQRRAAPTGSQSSLLSDFEQGKPLTSFGSRWSLSTDRHAGGRSHARYGVIPEGIDGEYFSLQVSGDISPAFAYAGVAFYPARFFWRTANLSHKQGLSFWAKGDSQTYRAMIATGSITSLPVSLPFVAGPQWQQFRLHFEQFGLAQLQLQEVRALTFAAGPQPGPFSFCIDHVELFS